MTGKRERKQQKERQVAALERMYHKFGFSSVSEMRKAMAIPKTTMSQALNRSDPRLMANETRLKVARFLGCQCAGHSLF